MLSIHTLYQASKECPSRITHTNTHTRVFIAARATVVCRETRCVYVTYSSVRAWMDASQTGLREVEEEEAVKQMFLQHGGKRGLYLSPFAS